MVKKIGISLLILATTSCNFNPFGNLFPKTVENTNVEKTQNKLAEKAPEKTSVITPVSQNHNESVPDVPPLKPETPTVVTIDNLKPSVTVPGNALEINLGKTQNDKSSGHSRGNSASTPNPDFNNHSSGNLSSNQGTGAVSNFPEDKEQKNTGSENVNSFENTQVITDIVLTETGQSIAGKDAPAAIIPNYSGKEVSITVNGNFDIFKSIKMEQMQFSLQPPLILKTQIGNEPKVQVLIDNSILLTPVSVSANSLVLKLNTKNIPDLYLEGLHKLSLVVSKLTFSVMIKVGKPELTPGINLSPVIYGVEVLKDEENLPVNLKLTGRNFMVYPKFSYSQVNGTHGFGHSTSIKEGEIWEKIIHIPDPSAFNQKAEHTIVYSTPFGSAFKTFGN